MDIEILKLKGNNGQDLLSIEPNLEEHGAEIGCVIAGKNSSGKTGFSLTTTNMQLDDNSIILYDSHQQKRVMLLSGNKLEGDTGGIIILKAANDPVNPAPDGSLPDHAIEINASQRSLTVNRSSNSGGPPLIELDGSQGLIGRIATTQLLLYQAGKGRDENNSDAVTPNSNASIDLDGIRGTLRAGGSESGAFGKVLLFSDNKSNTEIRNASIHLDGDKGSLLIGSSESGLGAHILLFSASNSKNEVNNATIHLDAEKGNLLIGSIESGLSANLLLFSANKSKSEVNNASIHLDAETGSLYLGGNESGVDGNVFLFSSDKSRSNTDNSTIHLDGNAGDIILRNADCAEEFDISQEVEPGTVMVFSEDGKLSECSKAYDKKVAGVISGGGDLKPAIILDRKTSQSRRAPLALMGKAFCKVDASYGAIEIGDLLTTSDTAGHAMKAGNIFDAFGSVIGKALQPCKEKKGLIPILITLQ